MIQHERPSVKPVTRAATARYESGSDEFGWPRAERYEILDGHIEPVGVSAIPASPWKEFETWRREKPSIAEAPYQDLLDLVFEVSKDLSNAGRQLRFVESLTLPSRSHDRIKQWCTAHGLLGLLPQRLMAIYRPPTWEVDAGGTLVPKITSALRTHAGWRAGDPVRVERWTQLLDESKLRPSKPVQGELIYPGKAPLDWPRDWVDAAPMSPAESDLREVIRYRDWRYRQPGEISSTVFFERYLVHHPETAEAPTRFNAPNTDAFWGWYREPLDEFIDVARRFVDGIRQYVQAQQEGVAQEDAPDDKANLEFFQGLARSVGVGTPSEDKDFVPMISSPSLLAAYAYMVVQDMTRLKLVLVCPECGRVFASRARRVIFCSVQCRNRVSKRRVKAASESQGSDDHSE